MDRAGGCLRIDKLGRQAFGDEFGRGDEVGFAGTEEGYFIDDDDVGRDHQFSCAARFGELEEGAALAFGVRGQEDELLAFAGVGLGDDDGDEAWP